jgi:hypothetical protein
MISLTTKAFLEDSQVFNFKIPDNIKLKSGEYEIVVVINANPEKKQTQKLTFSEHTYVFDNPDTTLSRSEIYGDDGR